MSPLIRLAGALALVAACLPVGSASALSYPVKNTGNGGDGSLRAAIEAANMRNGLDSIPIEVTGTIGLQEQLPPIVDDVTITGPGADSLTVERTASTPFRIFKVTNADATVSGLTVSGGKEHFGAGFLNETGSLTLVRVAVTGNQAFFEASGITTFAAGGGIISTGPLTVRESVVSGNSAVARGGETTVAAAGGLEASGAVTIERSTFSGNFAESFAEEEAASVAEGGGLLLTGGTATVEESTISGNSVRANEGRSTTVATGGGLVAFDLDLTASTVTGNSAMGEENGSILLVAGANLRAEGDVAVGNTIVANPEGNIDSCNAGAPGSGKFTSAGFNLDEDGSCGLGKSSDLTGVAPGLEPLADNGGPTPTHALAANSPAIDRGNSFGLATDQRGLPRPSDFAGISNKEGGDGSDIGAFELQAPAPPGPVLVAATPADRTPPQTRIVSGPPRNTYKTKAKFRFASSEPQSSFQCRLDRKKWSGCANPFRRTVRPGKHVFKVRAIDRFGNVDPTPARFGWRVKPIVG